MNIFYKDKLCEVMTKNGVDAMLIAPGEELEFILGHTTHICERFQALFIKASGEYFYVCNKLTEEEISVYMDGNKVSCPPLKRHWRKTDLSAKQSA